ncbi:strawberry notch C-terminal domain-containing protein, partial [Acinetobacter baumannii]
LLEPGWKADAAIQGLGRTHRTNQAQPPLFRPIATNVKAEKRFLSTIARRLDTLGAITRGQRQTGGQGLFRPEDNLESHYARDALRQLYILI